MKFLSKFKAVTHTAAVLGGAAIVWAQSAKGQAIIGAVAHQYPGTTVLVSVLAFLGTLYHNSHQSV